MSMHGSKIVVVGGIVGKNRLNDLHVLDVAAAHPQWTQPKTSGTPPPNGNLLQTFVIRDELIVLGATADGKLLTDLYSINLGAWLCVCSCMSSSHCGVLY